MILGGDSTLVRNDNGVTAVAHLEGLNPGGAYTMYWLFFNNPAACTHPVFTATGVKVSSCGPADLANFAAAPSFQYADGHVVGGSCKATFARHLTAGLCGNIRVSIHNTLSDVRSACGPLPRR